MLLLLFQQVQLSNYCFPYRQFLQDVLSETLDEISSDRTFMALINSVTLERQKKEELQNTILKWVTLYCG